MQINPAVNVFKSRFPAVPATIRDESIEAVENSQAESVKKQPQQIKVLLFRHLFAGKPRNNQDLCG